MTDALKKILELVGKEQITKEDYRLMQRESLGLIEAEYGVIEMVERRLQDLRLTGEIDF
tara:strand:- start:683 stop:859 length:177 start_codon:yes stop_codon:yes gene_type:complete